MPKFFGAFLAVWWFVVGIVRDFEELVLANEGTMSLGDFVGFSEQLCKAGYVLRVDNRVNYFKPVFEKPSVKDFFKRIFAFVTNRRLVLTQAQKFVFTEPEKVIIKEVQKEEPTTLVYKPYGKVLKYYN